MVRLPLYKQIPLVSTRILLGLAFLVGGAPLAAVSIEATRLGHDHAGSLWAWNRDKSELVIVAANSSRRILEIGAASAVDAHAEWGVAAVTGQSDEVVILSWDGVTRRRVPLQLKLSNLAWLAPGQVVVAPAAYPFLLGVLDIETGKVEDWIGKLEQVPTHPGAYFGRSTLLAVDFERERIHTLDSLSGEYRLFGFSGAELGSSFVANPRRPALDDWLANVDAQARQRGSVEFPTMWVFSLGLDEEGKAWTVQSCEPTTGRVVLARFEAGRAPELHEVTLDCCTQNMTVHSGSLVMAPVPRVAEDLRCSTERRLPR